MASGTTSFYTRLQICMVVIIPIDKGMLVRILALISFLMFSTLNPMAYGNMTSDSCCEEHVVHTTTHDHDNEPEDCSATDSCACHSPTSHALYSSTLAYFPTERNLILKQFNSPEPVFFSTPLRPPIS